MGYYINPKDTTKEDWLLRNAQEVVQPEWPPPPGEVIVCLVDNGAFRAAGIAYCQEEFEAFRAPDPTPEEIDAQRKTAEALGIAFFTTDRGVQRPRKWYLVPVDKLLEVCPRVQDVLVFFKGDEDDFAPEDDDLSQDEGTMLGTER